MNMGFRRRPYKNMIMIHKNNILGFILGYIVGYVVSEYGVRIVSGG